ncbi:MAG: zinc-dependent metalloprotease [Balneolaceae bacterium]
MKKLTLLFILFVSLPLVLAAQSTIAEKTAEMEKYEGFFDFWWDDEEGKIWLEIDKPDEEFIYVNSLAAGVGSNDIGLDRSQLGNTRIVKFTKVGPKVLMVQPNYDFRASSENELEKKSIEEAFAQSVIWGFEVEINEDGRLLVDATDFFLNDAHGVTGTLRSANQGSFSLDQSRSAIHLPGTFSFPKNSEFEATLTFTGSQPGRWLRSVTPTPEAVTVRQHHSFVELPDENYKPRKFDPRSGFFNISFQDYSAPIGGEFYQRYIARHRLEKKDPGAEISEPVEPIVYYLDNGTPEPVRTALLEGGRWWNEAFEAAGYQDAFRVEVLPDDAHPLDIRYNVINWVHRSTRGWSYGSSVTDPRTGEIIKGNVLLGSLRVRQDYLIAEGLLAPYEEGIEPDPQMLEMALDRIRQLSAHEIGHTLGIAHNFAASINDLASVMDYPHPMVTAQDDGTLSLENAYGEGIGEWDKRAVIYGYQHFTEDVNEDEALNDIIKETIDMGLLYLSDEVARPAGGSHPAAHLWEYGTDVVAQLDHILSIRKLALNRFGERNIRMGRPMSDIEDALVPVYLFHRYQTEATVKLIAGVDYAYTLRGDGQPGPAFVDAGVQRAALDALLQTLDSEVLALPENLLELIPPRPVRIPTTREHFRGYTSPVLDPAAIAEMAAGHTASLIFNPERSARLVNQAARNGDFPNLDEVIRTVLDHTLLAGESAGYNGSVQRAINTAVLRSLISLAGNENASPDVQAISSLMLEDLQSRLEERAVAANDIV